MGNHLFWCLFHVPTLPILRSPLELGCLKCKYCGTEFSKVKLSPSKGWRAFVLEKKPSPKRAINYERTFIRAMLIVTLISMGFLLAWRIAAYLFSWYLQAAIYFESLFLATTLIVVIASLSFYVVKVRYRKA